MSEIREFTNEQIDELVVACITQGGLIGLTQLKTEIEQLSSQLNTDKISIEALNLLIESNISTFRQNYEAKCSGHYEHIFNKVLSNNKTLDNTHSHKCHCHSENANNDSDSENNECSCGGNCCSSSECNCVESNSHCEENTCLMSEKYDL